MKSKFRVIALVIVFAFTFAAPSNSVSAKYVKTRSWMQYGYVLSVYQKCSSGYCGEYSKIYDQKLNIRKVGKSKSRNLSTGYRVLNHLGGGTNGKVIVFTGSYTTKGVNFQQNHFYSVLKAVTANGKTLWAETFKDDINVYYLTVYKKFVVYEYENVRSVGNGICIRHLYKNDEVCLKDLYDLDGTEDNGVIFNDSGWFVQWVNEKASSGYKHTQIFSWNFFTGQRGFKFERYSRDCYFFADRWAGKNPIVAYGGQYCDWFNGNGTTYLKTIDIENGQTLFNFSDSREFDIDIYGRPALPSNTTDPYSSYGLFDGSIVDLVTGKTVLKASKLNWTGGQIIGICDSVALVQDDPSYFYDIRTGKSKLMSKSVSAHFQYLGQDKGFRCHARNSIFINVGKWKKVLTRN